MVLLLSGLKSSYCYALHREVREEEVWGAAEDAGDGHPPAGAVADGVAVRAVMRVHVVEWSRRPSPHEPLPDVRVRMEVALLHPPSPSTPPLYRLEGELCVHPFVAGDASVGGRLQSVDGALLRALKMKAEMYRTPRTATPLSQQQTAFQRTRLAYHTFTPPPPRPSFAQPPLLPASQLLASLTQHLTTISSFTPSSCPPSIQCSGREAGGGAAQSKAKWSWSEDEDFDGEERGAGRAEEQPRENAVPSTPLKVLDGARGRPGAANDGAAAATAASAALNLAAATAASSATSITATTRDSTSSLSSASPLPAVSASASSSAASSASGSLSVSPYSVVPSAAALEGRLVDLFRGADADGSGRLSVSEVTALLSGGELGLSLSSSSLHAMVVGVMSTYDTNDDGQLVWAEFLPVAVDLLQTASAAKLAKAEMQRQREEGAAALERRLGGRSAADWAAEVAICVGALDPSHTHLLPPAAFQQLAHQLPCHLSGQPPHAAAQPLHRSTSGPRRVRQSFHHPPDALCLLVLRSSTVCACALLLPPRRRDGGVRPAGSDGEEWRSLAVTLRTPTAADATSASTLCSRLPPIFATPDSLRQRGCVCCCCWCVCCASMVWVQRATWCMAPLRSTA